jgi:hypothetical protein
MGIVGHHPETGLRIEVERPQGAGPPWRYQGHCVTPRESFVVVAMVDGDGLVVVQLDSAAPSGLSEKARLLLRAAWKHAHEEDVDPPRRIVRWRPDWRPDR